MGRVGKGRESRAKEYNKGMGRGRKGCAAKGKKNDTKG